MTSSIYVYLVLANDMIVMFCIKWYILNKGLMPYLSTDSIETYTNECKSFELLFEYVY